MSYELIMKIIFFLSFFGILYFIIKKIPVLVSLPEIKEREIFPTFKRKFKISNPFKKIPYEKILEKIIFKIRILSLKTENKTFQWLQNLRKKEKEKESYWEKIKKKLKE